MTAYYDTLLRVVVDAHQNLGQDPIHGECPSGYFYVTDEFSFSVSVPPELFAARFLKCSNLIANIRELNCRLLVAAHDALTWINSDTRELCRHETMGDLLTELEAVIAAAEISP